MGSGKFKITFTEQAITYLSFWHKSGNKAIIKKIEQLIESMADTPTGGIGKPELLKYELAGKYSEGLAINIVLCTRSLTIPYTFFL